MHKPVAEMLKCMTRREIRTCFKERMGPLANEKFLVVL